MFDSASRPPSPNLVQNDPEKPTGSVGYCKANAHPFVTTTGNAIIEVLLLPAKSFSRDGNGLARPSVADRMSATSSIRRVARNCIRNRHLVEHQPCRFRDLGKDSPHLA
jgi:hypothetical protein